MDQAMAIAFIRFYQELNDFLPEDRRQMAFEHLFCDRVSIKDMIESLGVPHTEVDLILVNGQSVDFSYIVRDRDFISIYPVFESIDISPVLKVRPEPLREPKFVLDVHLGKLAGYLRIMGFDSRYSNAADDETLAQVSVQEQRILLTRDRGLLKRKAVTHGYCLRAQDPKQQLKEVLNRFDLLRRISPLKRCLRCNAAIVPVEKQAVESTLPPKVRQFYDEFYRCSGCSQVYWKGSHYERMLNFIDEIKFGQPS